VNYPVCINNGRAKMNDDGSCTIVLGHRPMPGENWISCAGYREAVIFCRWLLAETMPETPTVERCRHPQ
jgi:hypothetical protein